MVFFSRDSSGFRDAQRRRGVDIQEWFCRGLLSRVFACSSCMEGIRKSKTTQKAQPTQPVMPVYGIP